MERLSGNGWPFFLRKSTLVSLEIHHPSDSYQDNE